MLRYKKLTDTVQELLRFLAGTESVPAGGARSVMDSSEQCRR